MKIGLCGTMSVGKTTLVKALQELSEFKEYQQEKEGLPWYKNPSMKAVARF